MIVGLARALRFARGWKGVGDGLREDEVEVRRSDGVVPASLIRPVRASGDLPGWVALHGITRPGRRHPTLLRFVRAVARSGATVLVPEIPEWRELLLAPEEAQDTLQASIRFLSDAHGVAPGGVGAIGFSFGVPRILEAAADPSLEGRIRAAVGFGGYADLERTLRFLFTGEHEWEGRIYRGDPDPYGRWVVAGNLLTRIREYEEAGDVAAALLRLAREAGDAQVGSWEAAFDGLKATLEQGVHLTRRELFRAFAPPAGALPPPTFARTIVPLLAGVGMRSPSAFDPAHHLSRVFVPVHLIHGREDRLHPFTESLRLKASFPPSASVSLSLTGLFAHSQRNGVGHLGAELAERVRFLRMLSRVLGMV